MFNGQNFDRSSNRGARHGARVFYVVLVLLLLLQPAFAAGSTAPATGSAQQGSEALVLVPFDSPDLLDQALRAGLIPYGRFSGPDGEFLLAGAALGVGEMELATAIPFRVLDQDTAGGTYYLAMMPPGVAGPDWAAYGRVLLDDGAQVLLRMTPGDAERLAEAGAEIAQITLEPMVVAPAGEPHAEPMLLLGITPNPLIQGMINQVSSTTVYNYDSAVERGAAGDAERRVIYDPDAAHGQRDVDPEGAAICEGASGRAARL